MTDERIDGPGPLLPGRVAVVTGGAGGIGAAIAGLFAEHGARVVIVDVDETRSEEVVNDISGKGGDARSIVADVSSANDVDRVQREVLDTFRSVDVLVNNVGHW